jgi:hypothetical protein
MDGLMGDITIYGFGSFFLDPTTALDIDLLIVYEDSGLSARRFAIACKRLLAEQIADVDVTMLSTHEEQHFQFIARSRAKHLGYVSSHGMKQDIELIVRNSVDNKRMHAEPPIARILEQ